MTIAIGQPLLASDINDLTFFPKGAILTFSNEAWSATSTAFKTIWKICNGQNGTPDLRNKFLRGGESSGTTSGADSRSVTLTAKHLPTHNHGATGLSMPNLSANGLSVSGLSISGLKATAGGSHEHTLSGGTTSAGNHQHDAHTGSAAMMISSSQSFTGALSTSHSGPSDGNSGDTRGTRGTLSINATHNLTGVHEHSFSSSSKAVATPAHEHDVTGGTISGGTISGNITSGSISGSTADAGSGLAFSVETLPVYYTVIYIMKVV